MKTAALIGLYVAATLFGALGFGYIATEGREADAPPPAWTQPVAAAAGALTGFILVAVFHKASAGGGREE